MGPRLQHCRPARPDADDQGGRPLRPPLHGAQGLIPANTTPAPSPRALRALRYLRLGIHLARGGLTIALLYPFASTATHGRLRQRWSRRMLDILGIRLQLEGERIAPGTMLVANHISWVDIFVINALSPAAFVSKAEVRSWPLIGWLAARNDTLFLRRGSRGHARIINAETAARLDSGRNVAIFPEGTTTDGSRVLDFHPALLQPAIASGHAVQALALVYLDGDGRTSRAPAYDGEVSLRQCLARIVAARELRACVRAAAPLATAGGIDRRELARVARDTIIALRAPEVAGLGAGQPACATAHAADCARSAASPGTDSCAAPRAQPG